MSTPRADVEAAIEDEERTLHRVAERIRDRVPFASWPEEDRRALALALLRPARDRMEEWKAWALAVHLFGPTEPDVRDAFGPLPDAPAEREVRWAERLRADLKAVVPLRSGLPLLSR